MKILVVSDIHGNYEALQSLLPYVESADKILCLGDIVGYSCAVNECIDFARKYRFICIKGNHEQYVIEGTEKQTKFLNESVLFGINHARRVITVENLEWLQSLPISIGLNFDGLSLLMVHGSPFNPINEYVYGNNTDFSLWKPFRYDFIFTGHTHRGLNVRVGDMQVYNPGSVGQSRDVEGKACAALLDTHTSTISRICVDYDYKKNLELSLSLGAGPWIYKHYQTLLSK